jgi:hypothetical protein
MARAYLGPGATDAWQYCVGRLRIGNDQVGAKHGFTWWMAGGPSKKGRWATWFLKPYERNGKVRSSYNIDMMVCETRRRTRLRPGSRGQSSEVSHQTSEVSSQKSEVKGSGFRDHWSVAAFSRFAGRQPDLRTLFGTDPRSESARRIHHWTRQNVSSPSVTQRNCQEPFRAPSLRRIFLLCRDEMCRK